MNDEVFFTLDLTTKGYFDNYKIEEIRDKIKSVTSETTLLTTISESCAFNKKFQLEIYAEAIPCKFVNPEDLLDFVVEIENMLGGFEDKSHIEWVSEFPHNVKNWEKQGYEWNLILEEEDDYFDSEDTWEEWEDE
jgi:hypothetical protein